MPRLKEILEKYGPSSTQLVRQTLLALHTHTKFKGKKCNCQPIPLYSIHNMDTGSSLPIQNFIPWKSGCLASIPSSILISLSVFMAEAHFCSCTEKNKATIKYFIVWVMCKFQAKGKMWILLWKKSFMPLLQIIWDKNAYNLSFPCLDPTQKESKKIFLMATDETPLYWPTLL